MRKLLTLVMITTVAATVAWTTITFFGDSTMLYTDPSTNITAPVPIPRLQIKAFYPWNPVGSSMAYLLTVGFQFYYLLFSMVHSNTSDVLFCSWVLFACEQLQHLKVC
jgi:odorant receptor